MSSAYHSTSSSSAIAAEAAHSAHNYHPLPVVFARASGVNVWDPEGKHYFDFLSGYSALNHGHCHPELVKALTEQASRLTLSSRAFYNDVFPKYAEFVTKFFGFDMVLPMNTGAEAVETAVKVARKWGYKIKGIPENEAYVLSVTENFHGRTVSILFFSLDILVTAQAWECRARLRSCDGTFASAAVWRFDSAHSVHLHLLCKVREIQD